jgi:hypothetical protein
MMIKLGWIKRIYENNILIKYEEELPINSRVLGVSCASHFTPSFVTVTSVLVQAAKGKCSHYFRQFTGRVES